MAPFFRNRMASQRRKDAALDLMIRARGILNVDDDVVVSAAVVIIAFGALLLTGYIVTERMVGI